MMVLPTILRGMFTFYSPNADLVLTHYRLGEFEDEQTDDEDNRTTTRGRVNIPNPRTPGGRLNRSMDIDRNFMFNSGGAYNNSYAREEAPV
jgi:hypothetical protein